MTDHPLRRTQPWQRLDQCRQGLAERNLRGRFAADPGRAQRFSRDLGPLHIDFSKQAIDDASLAALIDLAREAKVEAKRDSMFAGQLINNTEGRAVSHMALRATTAMEQVVTVRERFLALADAVREGRYGQPIRAVIHIGIGGSDLGPRMVVDALKTLGDGPEIRFLANVDGSAFERAVAGLDPQTTLAIVVSKSFSTIETKLNMEAVQAWLRAGGVEPRDRMLAITANVDAALAAGFAEDKLLPMWDWVGGRFSLWSAVGLPIALCLGSAGFMAMLAGAAAVDHHFQTQPLEDNLPVLLGLIDLWQINFQHAETRAVLCYDHRLKLLPPYLQQLEMESNGKRVRKDGAPVGLATAPVVWGGECTDGQHAYFQLIHQSERLIPTEFIAAIEPAHRHLAHHRNLLANCLAQSEALMRGKTRAEVEAELAATGMAAEKIEALAPHKVFPGNKPSTTILLERLDPYSLGALIALYEHRVFVEGALWDINSFDQWGVELGKQLAAKIDGELETGKPGSHDASTNALIRRVLKA